MIRVIAVAALLLSACKSPQEKYEPAARAALAALPPFAILASTAPPVDASATARLAQLKDASAKYLDSNVLLIHLEELANPTLRRRLTVRLNQRSPTVDCAAALKLTSAEPGAVLDPDYQLGTDSEDNMKDVWQRMGSLKYLLVVRTQTQQDAQLMGENTFKGGSWSGEVLVFDFPGKTLLGGFPVEASHHGTVQSTMGRGAENLAADLRLAARGNLNVALRKAIPSIGANDTVN